MANGRGERTKRDTGRDGGGFVALPWVVLDCPAYLALPHPARALLMEVARQLHGDDNGRLLLSRAHLAKRGWKSADVIQRAKAQLLCAGLIFETVKGGWPNSASWYAVTWRRLDKLNGYDAGTEQTFKQGAYRSMALVPPKTTAKQSGAALVPFRGTTGTAVGPADGTWPRCAVPPDGLVRAVFGDTPVPSAGHPLEKPSSGALVLAAINSTGPNSDRSRKRRAPPETLTTPAAVEDLNKHKVKNGK